MLVALPDTVDQVQALLKYATAHGVPVVARGAGTGLSGGALPLEKGILLVMARFNRILDVDPEAGTARVQPGVRNLAISQAAAPHGLYYAPDPSSQIACSIGGNVAENAGGVHCLKYGLTVHNILKIEIVTIDGERLTLGSEALDAPGFDLLALFTGSEGMLGVVVEVTVKLLAKPQSAKVLLASFDDIGKAGDAVAQIIGAGVIPGGLEMMDNLAIRAAEDFIHAGYPVDAEAILLCEIDGAESDVQEDCERVEALLRAAGATEIRAREERSRTPALLGGPQERVPGGGPHLARLLLHGRHHSAPRTGARAEGHRGSVSAIRAAGRERVPCRRRQHASADPLRCQRARRNGSRRDARRAHPRTVRRGGRQHHGRARRGPREDQPDVRAIQQRRTGVLPRA